MKKIIAPTLAGAFLLSACVNPEIVQRTNLDDASLTCDEISVQLAQLEEIRTEAAKGRTASGENIAAAILFWPAIIGNFQNAKQALEAANARNDVLIELAKEKNC